MRYIIQHSFNILHTIDIMRRGRSRVQFHFSHLEWVYPWFASSVCVFTAISSIHFPCTAPARNNPKEWNGRWNGIHTHTYIQSPITRSIHADDIIYGAGICFSNLYLISFLECYMAYVREFTVHIYIGEKHRGEERESERERERKSRHNFQKQWAHATEIDIFWQFR